MISMILIVITSFRYFRGDGWSYSICDKICLGFSRMIEILDTSTAATSRTPPTTATSRKCSGVTITFSAALPNSVPRVPATCLLER